MTVCEDLATKAELQELRDQLNLALGTKEDGTTQTLFVRNAGTTGISSGVNSTLLGMATTNAPNFITDIELEDSGTEVTPTSLANGTAKLSVVKGNGSTQQPTAINTAFVVAGTGALASSFGGKLAKVSGLSISLLANLTQIAGTLALNIATVNVLDKRIDAEARGATMQIDAVNSTMLRLYDKQQGDIDAVVADLEANQQVVRQNQQNIQDVRNDVIEVNRLTSELNQKIVEANFAIQELQTENSQLRQELQDSRIETQELIDDLTARLETTEAYIGEYQSIILEQKSTIESMTEQIDAMDTKLTDLEYRFDTLETDYEDLKQSFEDVKRELTEDIEDHESRITKLEAKDLKNKAKVVRRGGGGAAGFEAATNAQIQTVKLVSQLAGVEYDPSFERELDPYIRNQRFQEIMNALLPQIQLSGTMTPEQLQDLQTGISTGVATNITDLLTTTFIPRLDTIDNQVTDRRITANVQSGICESLNGGGSCPATPGSPNPTQGLRGMQQGLQAGQNNIANLLGLGNLGLNQTMLGIVSSTNAVVTNPVFGIQAIFNFMSTAWRVTRADKVMNAVSMVMTVHNGMMLSNNLLSSVSEAINMSLNALNIKDETDTPIDIGSKVKSMIETLVTSMIGAENYEALTTRIAKANRIYQSSVNVLDSVNNLFDSARSVAEMTAEHTGKIGNALREAGVVYEDAYGEFAERINPQSKAQRNIEKFRGTIEGVGEAVETVTQISSGVVEFQENIDQLKDSKNKWKDEVKELTDTQEEEKATAKIEAQVTADISGNDFDRSTDET